MVSLIFINGRVDYNIIHSGNGKTVIFFFRTYNVCRVRHLDQSVLDCTLCLEKKSVTIQKSRFLFFIEDFEGLLFFT